MTYEVRLVPQAVLDLRYLYQEKRVEVSSAAAVWFLGLERAIFSLQAMPHRGTATSGNNSVRQLLYGRKPNVYQIIYTIDEQSGKVEIAQVRHGARGPLPTP